MVKFGRNNKLRAYFIHKKFGGIKIKHKNDAEFYYLIRR